MGYLRLLDEACAQRNISDKEALSLIRHRQTAHDKIALRNAIICELHQKYGLTVLDLAELVPMSVRRIQEIVYFGYKETSRI